MQPPTRDRLAANAYRTLGLGASAGQAAIEGAARRMRIWPDPARIPPTPWDLPQLGPPARSRTDIEHAVARLIDPASRLEDRLLWYHCTGPAPAPSGQNTPASQGSHAPVADRHNRAVAALHAASVAAPGAADAGLWRQVFDEFGALSDSPDYLAWLSGVEDEGRFEKRASDAEIGAAVRSVPGAVLAAVVPHAKAALERDDAPAYSALLELLRAGSRSPETAAPLRGLLDALEDALDAHCRRMDADLRDKLRTVASAPEPYYPANFAASADAMVFYLDNVAPALTRVQVAAAGDADRVSRAKTRCAEVLALLALGWEWCGRFIQSERTLLQALELADSASVRAEIQASLDRVRPLVAEERASTAGSASQPAPATQQPAPWPQAAWPQPQPRRRDPMSTRRLIAVSVILGVAASMILSLMTPGGNSRGPGYNPSPPETSVESANDAAASDAPANDPDATMPAEPDKAPATDVGEVNREP